MECENYVFLFYCRTVEEADFYTDQNSVDSGFFMNDHIESIISDQKTGKVSKNASSKRKIPPTASSTSKVISSYFNEVAPLTYNSLKNSTGGDSGSKALHSQDDDFQPVPVKKRPSQQLYVNPAKRQTRNSLNTADTYQSYQPIIDFTVKPNTRSSLRNTSSLPKAKVIDPTKTGPMVVYHNDKQSLTITWEDYGRLDDGEFLNDTIIEYHIRYMLHESHKNLPANQVYIFSSFFFSKLGKNVDSSTGINFESIKKWTKNVNIFEKEFVFIPINEKYPFI